MSSPEEIPAGAVPYEPKWDGFRAIVFRDAGDVFIQSRDLRPFDRYFPDLHDIFLKVLPPGCVVDGEIVIATKHGLDFDALQMRLHPAASRVAMLANQQPASFVAFDLPSRWRGHHAGPAGSGVNNSKNSCAREAARYLTPATRDRATVVDWLKRFEGGIDGVIKPEAATYQPGKRVMLKIKHVRTADCVVAGFGWHKSGKDAVGSLLLGRTTIAVSRSTPA
jgi:ATP-dependent DNA ligase